MKYGRGRHPNSLANLSRPGMTNNPRGMRWRPVPQLRSAINRRYREKHLERLTWRGVARKCFGDVPELLNRALLSAVQQRENEDASKEQQVTSL